MAKRKGKKRVTKKAKTSKKTIRRTSEKGKPGRGQARKTNSRKSRPTKARVKASQKTSRRAVQKGRKVKVVRKDPSRVAAAILGHKRKRERERQEYERRSQAAKLGHRRKLEREAKEREAKERRAVAGLIGWQRRLEREESERRSIAARLGWQRKWEKEGRKPKPVRKGAPAEQPRKPRKVKTKVKPKPEPEPFARGTPEGEAQIMRERMERAQIALPDSTVLGPVINADGTVDAELLVYLQKGQSVRELSLDIEEVLRPPRGQWFNVGIRVPPNKAIESPDDYERALGLIQIQMHSRRSRYAGPAWNDWREEVLPKIEKGTKGWRKPEQLFVRLYWSPVDDRPDY